MSFEDERHISACFLPLFVSWCLSGFYGRTAHVYCWLEMVIFARACLSGVSVHFYGRASDYFQAISEFMGYFWIFYFHQTDYRCSFPVCTQLFVLFMLTCRRLSPPFIWFNSDVFILLTFLITQESFWSEGLTCVFICLRSGFPVCRLVCCPSGFSSLCHFSSRCGQIGGQRRDMETNREPPSEKVKGRQGWSCLTHKKDAGTSRPSNTSWLAQRSSDRSVGSEILYWSVCEEGSLWTDLRHQTEIISFIVSCRITESWIIWTPHELLRLV